MHYLSVDSKKREKKCLQYIIKPRQDFVSTDNALWKHKDPINSCLTLLFRHCYFTVWQLGEEGCSYRDELEASSFQFQA